MKCGIRYGMIGMVCIFAGILLAQIMKILSVILIIADLILCLGGILAFCFSNADRCPNCGTVLYRNVKVYREQKDGLIRCPKCNALVQAVPRKKGN